MVGTLINFGAIVIGGGIGLAFRAKFPENLRVIVFQAMGLFTLFLGVSMALKMNEILLGVFALILGGITGELLRLEMRMNNLAGSLKNNLKFGDARFTEGLVTAFLMFCMGSMTILGSLEEGMGKLSKVAPCKIAYGWYFGYCPNYGFWPWGYFFGNTFAYLSGWTNAFGSIFWTFSARACCC